MIVDGLVLHRDAGFVLKWQDFTIRLDAFPFTRDGYLKGVLEHISPDATVDEARGLVSSVRLRITETKLRDVAHTASLLSPGMSANFEVITRRRRALTTCSRRSRALHRRWDGKIANIWSWRRNSGKGWPTVSRKARLRPYFLPCFLDQAHSIRVGGMDKTRESKQARDGRLTCVSFETARQFRAHYACHHARIDVPICTARA